MNLRDYQENRRLRAEQTPRRRKICTLCRQPDFGCYCTSLQPFDPKIEFVVLIHPIEVKRRIATGRMAHLSLKNSSLIQGEDFTDNAHVNSILRTPEIHSVILYPGSSSINLTPLAQGERQNLFPEDKRLAIFVIDGTWGTARKMVRSTNLANLPRICFSPERPTGFLVRKQPKVECYSTIEAIHHTIELLGESRGYSVEERQHDRLLQVFSQMVERQLECVRTLAHSRQAVSKRARAARRIAPGGEVEQRGA